MNHKSKAEERRAEWLSRQYAAEQASGVDTFVAEQVAKSNVKHKRERDLAAARDSVIEAAMALCRVGRYDGAHEWDVLRSACAALAKLEGQ